MPKQKSSASSATKKKHARRTAAREEQLAARALAEEEQELLNEEQNGQDNDDAAAHDDKIDTADVPAQATDADGVKPAAAAPTTTTPSVTTAKPEASIPAPLLDKRGKRIKDIPPSGNSRGQKDAAEKKKQKKQSKKHAKGQAPPPPRKKQYIPPPKPVKTNVDPVDIYGLGIVGAGYERIPAEKVVSLRLLNKKDSMSVERGLDELLAWINEVERSSSTPSEADDGYSKEEALTQLSEAVPVWVHHLSRLLAHASRRVRYLTASIHSLLLHQGSSDLLAYTVPAFTTPSNLEREDFLSCQLCATFDPDRQVRSLSVANWKALSALVPPPNYLEEILNSLTDSILESSASSTSAEKERAKRKLSDEERIALQEEQDRKVNHLTASIEAFSSMLQHCTSENASLFTKVTSSDSFWAFLSSKEMEAPQARRATWRTLALILSHDQSKPLLEDSLPTISRIAPRAAFSERDHPTQNTLWEPLISLFRKYPSIWKRPLKQPSDSDEDASSSDSDSPSSSPEEETDASAASARMPHTIANFLDLLQVGFYGNAQSGYQATPLLIHTIPENIFPRTPSNLDTLFSSYWAAYSGAAINSESTPAFVRCLIDIVRLSLVSESAAEVAVAQLKRLWEYYLHITPPPSKYTSLTSSTTVEELEKGLVSLQSKYPTSFDEVWTAIRETARQTVLQGVKAAALAQALIQMFRSPSTDVSQRSQKLLHELTVLAASNEQAASAKEFLLEALSKDGSELLIGREVHEVRCEQPGFVFTGSCH